MNEVNTYIEASFAKLEGQTRELVIDAFEAAWEEQQDKLDQILSILDKLQYSSGERIYKEIKEFLK